jgi:hypothetical protein
MLRILSWAASAIRPSRFELATMSVIGVCIVAFFRPQERVRLDTFPVLPTLTATFGQEEQISAGGLAILTPTAAFGQEENRQSVAQIFATSIAKLRPDMPTVPLAETLSRLNATALAAPYKAMYENYAQTGLFDRDVLRAVGDATGVRYLVQLKLQSFNQSSKPRFGYLGMSVLQTQTASVRLFAQIWDSREGRIVWEQSAEAARQIESIRERPVTMESVVESAVEELIKQMPD